MKKLLIVVVIIVSVLAIAQVQIGSNVRVGSSSSSSTKPLCALTTAETGVAGNAFFVATCSIPANTLAVGNVIRVRARGRYSLNSGTSTSVGFEVWGGATGATQLSVSNNPFQGSNVTNAPWGIDADIVVTAIGASGAVEEQDVRYLAVQAVGNQTNYLTTTLPNSATITVDTTAAFVVKIKIALAGQTADLRIFNVYVDQ